MKTTIAYFTEDVQQLLGISSHSPVYRLLEPEIANQLYSLPTVLTDRSWCEKDDRLLQPICYMVLRKLVGKEYQYLTYQRGQNSGETRLILKRSLGYGGHAETLPTRNVREVLSLTAIRELSEELGPSIIDPSIQLAITDQLKTPVIYWDPLDAVNKVHLAFFITLRVQKDFVISEEKGIIKDTRWTTLLELEQMNLEGWSKAYLKRYLS